eukprot:5929503-Pleurochrysis_carterae.AAC.1
MEQRSSSKLPQSAVAQTFHLQLRSRDAVHKAACAPVLAQLHFFETYGMRLNYETTGIAVTDGG